MELNNDFKFLMAKYEYEQENYELVLGICDELIEEGYIKAYGLKGITLFYFNEKEAQKVFEEGVKKGDLISMFFKLLIDDVHLVEPSKILRQTNDIPLMDVIGVLLSHLDYEVEEFFAAMIYSYSLTDIKKIFNEYLKVFEEQNDKRVIDVKRFLNLIDEINKSHINTIKVLNVNNS